MLDLLRSYSGNRILELWPHFQISDTTPLSGLLSTPTFCFHAFNINHLAAYLLLSRLNTIHTQRLDSDPSILSDLRFIWFKQRQAETLNHQKYHQRTICPKSRIWHIHPLSCYARLHAHLANSIARQRKYDTCSSACHRSASGAAPLPKSFRRLIEYGNVIRAPLPFHKYRHGRGGLLKYTSSGALRLFPSKFE